MFNWYKKYTPFQKWFLCIFMILSVLSLLLPKFTGATWGEVFEFDAIIGFLSAITGVLNSVYVCRAEIILFLYWGLNTAFYGIQCLIEHLYAEFFLEFIVILPLIIWGYCVWVREIRRAKNAGEMKEDDKIRIKKFSSKQWAIALGLFIIGWVGYGIFIHFFPEIMRNLFNISVVPDSDLIIDAFIAIGTIYAVFLTNIRHVENWLFWLAINIAGTVLFVYSTVQSATGGHISIIALGGVIMYIQYLTSSIYGYWCWIKLNKEQTLKK